MNKGSRAEGAGGIRRLLLGALDPRGIRPLAWYAPALFLMPAVFLLSYGAARATGRSLPEPEVAWPAVPVLFLGYLAAAFAEEVAWMGHLAPVLLRRWSALQTGVLIGLIWVLWHVIPYLMLGSTWPWLAWQSFFMVAARVPSAWGYVHAGRSALADALMHATSNLSVALFPVNGSHYDPAITGCIAATVPAGVMAMPARNAPRTGAA